MAAKDVGTTEVEETTVSAPRGFRRTVRRVTIGVVGGSVTAVGLVMLPLPGPGTPIVLAGLAILSTEFEAAARQRRRIADGVRRALGRDADRDDTHDG